MASRTREAADTEEMAMPDVLATADHTTTDALAQHCLALALDQIDHGLILVDARGKVLHANRVARAELTDPDHALQMTGGAVLARHPADAVLLRDALAAANGKGLRRLITLGTRGQMSSLAVMPLLGGSMAAPGAAAEPQATLLMLGKRSGRVSLATYWFARSCGLTAAEDQVLQALCSGVAPRDIARDHSVAVSTVRTQLASIRAKTRSGSLRELMRCMAQLPPVAPTIPSVR
jgi:DNA-binding CsgD family transcriptional regulator